MLLDPLRRLLAGQFALPAAAGFAGVDLAQPLIPQRRPVGLGARRQVLDQLLEGAHRDVELVGVGQLPEERRLMAAQFDAQAHLLPILLDQLQQLAARRTDLDGLMMDGELQRAAVRRQPEPLAVALRQAHFVEQLIGQPRIVLRVRLRPGVIVHRKALRYRRLARRALAKVDHFVDLVAVDRHRQRDAKVAVLNQLALDRVGHVPVGLQPHLRAEQARHQVHAVIAGRLALLVQGEVLEGGEQVGDVALAGHDLQVIGLGVDDLPHHRIDVGQLVARRVDHHVVGVALHHLAHGVGGGEHPRMNARLGEVLLGIPPVVGAERVRPGVESLLLRQSLGVGVVVDMPLLQVVGGLDADPAAAGGSGEGGDDVGHRIVPGDREAVFADPLRVLHRRAHEVPHLDLLLQVHVLEGEDEVLGIDRIAVRPAHAGPHVQGEAGEVGRLLVIDDQAAVEGAVEVLAEEARPDLGHVADVLPGTGIAVIDEQGAAVAADLVEHRPHHRLRRQPLVHRRQLPLRHQRRQYRRLVEAPRRGAGGRARGRRRTLLVRPGRKRRRAAQRERRRGQRSYGITPHIPGSSSRKSLTTCAPAAYPKTRRRAHPRPALRRPAPAAHGHVATGSYL